MYCLTYLSLITVFVYYIYKHLKQRKHLSSDNDYHSRRLLEICFAMTCNLFTRTSQKFEWRCPCWFSLGSSLDPFTALQYLGKQIIILNLNKNSVKITILTLELVVISGKMTILGLSKYSYYHKSIDKRCRCSKYILHFLIYL